MIHPVPQADRFEELARPYLPLLAISFRQRERGHEHVLEDAALREQVVELKDEPNRLIPEFRQPCVIEFPEVLPSHPDFAGVCLVKRADDIQQRTLSAAGRAKDRDRLPGIDPKIEVMENFHGVTAIGSSVGFREM